VRRKSTEQLSGVIKALGATALFTCAALPAGAGPVVWNFVETGCGGSRCAPVSGPVTIGTVITDGGAGSSIFRAEPTPTLMGSGDFTFGFGRLHEHGEGPAIVYDGVHYIPDAVKSWHFAWGDDGMPLTVDIVTVATEIHAGRFGATLEYVSDAPSSFCLEAGSCSLFGFWEDPDPAIATVAEPSSIGILAVGLLGFAALFPGGRQGRSRSWALPLSIIPSRIAA
jgi:hypothetical protein